jgi:hypothetical protein
MGAGTNPSRHAFAAEPYIVISDSDGVKSSDWDPFELPGVRANLLNTAFFATWSMFLPDSITPRPRTSQWSIHLADEHRVLMGYGIDASEVLTDDVWSLDLAAMKWSRVPINLFTVPPRNGTVAVHIGRMIYLFGGFSGRSYLADFHAIDMQTLEVQRPTFSGPSPPGRVGHVMAEHQDQILIWGGYNGEWLSDLWILDVQRMVWHEVKTTIRGRTSAAFAKHGNSLYIFGACKSEALLRFHWPSERLEVVRAIGLSPPPELSHASMIAVDQFLLVFGGKVDRPKYCLMYGFDTRKHRWFIFHVRPDSVTTTATDGLIDKNGLFMVPRIWSASILYRKQAREVVLFLGEPFLEPPHVSIVSLGDALAFLHLQSDLFEFMHPDDQTNV